MSKICLLYYGQHQKNASEVLLVGEQTTLLNLHFSCLFTFSLLFHFSFFLHFLERKKEIVKIFILAVTSWSPLISRTRIKTEEKGIEGGDGIERRGGKRNEDWDERWKKVIFRTEVRGTRIYWCKNIRNNLNKCEEEGDGDENGHMTEK